MHWKVLSSKCQLKAFSISWSTSTSLTSSPLKIWPEKLLSLNRLCISWSESTCVTSTSQKMLYVSWLWSLYVGVQGCGFKMFRAVARGNDSPKETDVGMAENDLILIACLIWKQEKYMIEYLLHAVGPCWRRCLSCCYSWPCNLLLNCSIPPKASFSSLCQFKLGNCRLVYKWSLWVWRKMGF